MLKIAEYNTITGEKIDLKQLEKYGFKILYDEKTGEPKELIKKRTFSWGELMYKISFKKYKIRLKLGSSNGIWAGNLECTEPYYLNEWQEILYDLIKDGIVEKV